MINSTNDRRLLGVANLYGKSTFDKFQKSHVVVVGLGGVGSWAAEALARSGIGKITLIDFDHVSIGNTNRQLHALEGNYGKSKVLAMYDRLYQINDSTEIISIDDFVTPENVNQLLPADAAVIDATDSVSSKIAMAVWARKNQSKFVMCGCAGGKRYPTKVTVSDLSKCVQDPLLSKIRSQLRKKFNFEKDPKKQIKINTVFSQESRSTIATGGLSCNGYGSVVTVTATIGFYAAAEILNQISNNSYDTN
jgi:tRNA A37 threonylcarbamoyladenosine dehydratase